MVQNHSLVPVMGLKFHVFTTDLRATETCQYDKCSGLKDHLQHIGFGVAILIRQELFSYIIFPPFYRVYEKGKRKDIVTRQYWGTRGL